MAAEDASVHEIVGLFEHEVVQPLAVANIRMGKRVLFPKAFGAAVA